MRDEDTTKAPTGARETQLARVADLLSSACNGGESIEANTTGWGAERFAEHIHQRVGEIVAFLFKSLPDAEDLGQPYGDAFDAIEAALRKLAIRDEILARLVAAGYVTESLIDDMEDRVVAETQP